MCWGKKIDAEFFPEIFILSIPEPKICVCFFFFFGHDLCISDDCSQLLSNLLQRAYFEDFFPNI